MSTWRKVGYCLIAAVAAFVARAEDYVLPEAPDTQWTIYTTGTYQSGYYDFEDGTGWRFTINSSGSVYLRGLEQTEGTADMLNFQTVPEFPDGRKMLKFMALDLSGSGKMATAQGLLKVIWLPSTLTALDTSVFSGFSKLEACVFHPDSKPALGNTVFYKLGMQLTQPDTTYRHVTVGRGLRPRRNRNKTRYSLNYDCGSPGVRSLPLRLVESTAYPVSTIPPTCGM